MTISLSHILMASFDDFVLGIYLSMKETMMSRFHLGSFICELDQFEVWTASLDAKTTSMVRSSGLRAMWRCAGETTANMNAEISRFSFSFLPLYTGNIFFWNMEEQGQTKCEKLCTYPYSVHLEWRLGRSTTAIVKAEMKLILSPSTSTRPIVSKS